MVYRDQRGCPHCGSRLAKVSTRSYSYERCAKCAGLWVSLAVVSEMAGEIAPGTSVRVQPTPARSGRPCPDCRVPLNTGTLFRIPVDYCAEKQEGVWFDKDELAQFLERIACEDPPPPEPITSFSSLLRDFFEAR
ncbi:MAG: zf-TFIIB domain-containing protein [Deltaproteobacteria bacterium]|nr:zf-TFIIB domain-containing protein [Deltaproteobacteria bacterium]